MKVILQKEHKGLGHVGDVVNVAPGYALNFLFPEHIAVEASPAALAKMKAQAAARVREKKNTEKGSRALAAKLDGLEMTLAFKATPEGALYGAVHEKDVAKALRKEGYAVSPEQVEMRPIKSTGEYPVLINFDGGFEANIRLTIESAPTG
ncbi:50S ribosomal protein L9 [Candidatus Uhrbacteria bacterium]|nr:50S ribosomal protein L9 [Candidatus Uhrbacteria bacterium]